MKFRVRNSLKYEKEVNKSDAQAFSYASADSHHTRNTINFPSFTLAGAGSELLFKNPFMEVICLRWAIVYLEVTAPMKPFWQPENSKSLKEP